jgi:hypothetical protein
MPVSTTSYTEYFIRQSNEITNNPQRAVDINNKLVINAVNVARNNLKIYNRTVDAVRVCLYIAKTCRAFSAAPQQQQFSK